MERLYGHPGVQMTINCVCNSNSNQATEAGSSTALDIAPAMWERVWSCKAQDLNRQEGLSRRIKDWQRRHARGSKQHLSLYPS